MSAAQPTVAAPESPAAEAMRDRWYVVALVGLILAIAGSTAAALQNSLYPCEPATGSSVAPPLADCAVALAPGGTVFLAGLVLAAAGYLKVR